MRILLVPEDFRNDQYILRPLFQRLLRKLGKPRAKVVVCGDPLLGGVGEALKGERLAEIVERYDGMIDLFVLCVDRDGNPHRRSRLNEIEAEFEKHFLAENAWEELETWVLAGLDLPKPWRWSEVRAEVSVKERYFEPLARRRGLASHPGGGRKPLGEESARRVDAIRQRCPEDFGVLADRLAAAVSQAGRL